MHFQPITTLAAISLISVHHIPFYSIIQDANTPTPVYNVQVAIKEKYPAQRLNVFSILCDAVSDHVKAVLS